MRKPCLECVRKHLAAAQVAESESLMGYPLHACYMRGHMVHAEEEVLGISREFAMCIRQHRINSTGDTTYSVPWDALLAFTYILEGVDTSKGDNIPSVTEDCLAGIATDLVGEPVWSADTRA